MVTVMVSGMKNYAFRSVFDKKLIPMYAHTLRSFFNYVSVNAWRMYKIPHKDNE